MLPVDLVLYAVLTATASMAANPAAQVAIVGTSGVSAMQMAVIDESHVVIFDNAEANALNLNGNPAWGQIMNFAGSSLVNTPIPMVTDTFCAAGSFLSNGSLISVGGSVAKGAPVNAQIGYQAIRVLTPSLCSDSSCPIYDNPNRTHTTSKRWYPSTVRLQDGSVMIIGGDTYGALFSIASRNNPTLEFFPPKGNGQAIQSKFFSDALPQPLFPHVYLLPDGTVFMAANNLAMTYNWQTNTEHRLPNIPGAPVTYPTSAASAMLPLDPVNNYSPTIMFCGGSKHPQTTTVNTGFPAWDQCEYMNVFKDTKWSTFAALSKRVMGEFVQLPNGKLLLLNGASDGIAGYGGGNKSAPNIGSSNAATPNLVPEYLDPVTRQWTTWTATTVPRMYHSTVTLLPDSRILIAGSNPHGSVSTKRFATEYRIETITPPYLATGANRPSIIATTFGRALNYNHNGTITLDFIPPGTTNATLRVVLMDLGFSTHALKMDHRQVILKASLIGNNSVFFVMPPNANIYPPGPGWIFISFVNDLPVKMAKRLLVGLSTQQPPVNKAALAAAVNTKPYPVGGDTAVNPLFNDCEYQQNQTANCGAGSATDPTVNSNDTAPA